MKQQPKLMRQQLNLPFPPPSRMELPPDKQRELALALSELLLQVALPAPAQGDEHELEANR